MRHIQARFEELGASLSKQTGLTSSETVLDLAKHILPVDDSSLQWSEVGSGITDNPSQALENIFERMVMRYDEKQVRQRRTEDDIWRNFRRNLESRHLLKYFKPKTIAVMDDQVDFKHAWKNGEWRLRLEPLSFDLSSAERIKDKAHKWLGQIASVKIVYIIFRLYFLIGQPQDDELKDAFDSALNILRKIPTNNEIYLEQDAEKLTERIADEMKEHHSLRNH